jgi:hypothetical protein
MQGQRLSRTIETLANAGIVIVAILGAAVLVKQLATGDAPQPTTASTRPSAARPRAPAPGSRISVPGVRWDRSEQTLVLVLSTTCRFCTDSADFYQRLVNESHRAGKTRLLAVLPQGTSEATRYLSDLHVRIDEVVQAPLAAVNAGGTPTLILVDRSGTVKRTWLGRLPPERETEILGIL